MIKQCEPEPDTPARYGAAWPWLGFCLLAGCGSAGGPALTPVTGTVTLDDKPLAGALVRFMPQGNTKGNGGSARTDAAGKYEIVAHAMSERKGLLPGDYKVMVTRLVTPEGVLLLTKVTPIDKPSQETVPEPYCKPQLTPLEVTIGAEAVTYDVPLKK
jgi:hypothetical protein